VKKNRLLILNDDPDIVEAMTAVLEDAGYEVAGSGHRLLDEVIKFGPDVLLIDIPPNEEKEGLNFIQRVRLEPKTASVPVLLGTTSLKHLEPALLRDKMIYTLVRPFEVAELLKAVEDLLAAAALAGISSPKR
jgi:CheY-like chemotaxis protein